MRTTRRRQKGRALDPARLHAPAEHAQQRCWHWHVPPGTHFGRAALAGVAPRRAAVDRARQAPATQWPVCSALWRNPAVGTAVEKPFHRGLRVGNMEKMRLLGIATIFILLPGYNPVQALSPGMWRRGLPRRLARAGARGGACSRRVSLAAPFRRGCRAAPAPHGRVCWLGSASDRRGMRPASVSPRTK